MDNPLLFQSPTATSAMRSAKIHGVVIGIVTDNACGDVPAFDLDYRVKVKFPWINDTDQSAWARIATPMASAGGVGVFFLPEIDDEVLVTFVNGDFNHPVVIGCLWNGKDKPAFGNKEGKTKTTRYHNGDAKFLGKADAKKNDVRSISTRKKHELIFNDNASEPRVTIASGQKHRIVLDDKGNEPLKIEIYDGKEENYILIDTKNKKITIESKTGEMLLKAKTKIRLECETLETDSTKETKLKVGTNFTMEASSNMKLQASGTGEVKSNGQMTIKGATVNIN
jgi:uncharacterized protein involved in type VI secretion and phage assembly